jgi:hypothetical protein
MTRAAAEITGNAREQRRRSVPDRKNAPSRAHGRGLRRCPEGSVTAWDAWNAIVETPRPDGIVNIAETLRPAGGGARGRRGPLGSCRSAFRARPG